MIICTYFTPKKYDKLCANFKLGIALANNVAFCFVVVHQIFKKLYVKKNIAGRHLLMSFIYWFCYIFGFLLLICIQKCKTFWVGVGTWVGKTTSLDPKLSIAPGPLRVPRGHLTHCQDIKNHKKEQIREKYSLNSIDGMVVNVNLIY